MSSKTSLHSALRNSLAIIMGGGAGTRLFPLTKDRSKPAVPLGGKYRLVDIPISNCLNSGLRQIFVLTQFNSTSLHKHINAGYKFDHFSRSFVEILAAQQTPESESWYQGTADAVRKNMRDFLNHDAEYFIILSGDQLYRMDYRALLEQHLEQDAEITIATLPVSRKDASGFGIMHSDQERTIFKFEEKPQEDALLDQLKIPSQLLKDLGRGSEEDLYQASMGIYIFNRKVLEECLDNDYVDFGKHIIPKSIENYRVKAYIFQGYWEDIGTIRSFYEANLDLTNDLPQFSFFDVHAPIYTHPRFLPASKINAATIKQAIVSDGCVISDAHLERCVIGVRSTIRSGATIRDSIIMGSDFFENEDSVESKVPPIGIGRNSVIEKAIVDKNARIGEGCVISPEGKPDHMDGDNFYIRDGIVVVPKNAIIRDGVWI